MRISKLPRLKKTQRRLLFAAAILGLMLFGMTLFTRRVVLSLPDQNEALRWDEEGGAAQVTCFFLQDAVVTPETIRMARYQLDKALSDASVTRDLSKPSARLYADCYSALGRVTLQAGSGKVTVRALGVGGDFFLFHPITLLSGGYFSGSDLMKDGLILDEEVAWQLFGSNDIVGQLVDLGGVTHRVVGVAQKPQGRLLRAAGDTEPTIWLSFDSLTRYGVVTGAGIFGGTSAVGKYQSAERGVGSYADAGWAAEIAGETPAGGISCYEVVLPNIVRHFGRDLVRDKMGFAAEETLVVENSARFQAPALWKVLSSFGRRSMHWQAIRFPYWENEARGWEDILALVLLFKIICSTCLLLLAVFAVVQAYRGRRFRAADLFRRLADANYDRQVRRAAEQRRKQESRSFSPPQNAQAAQEPDWIIEEW